MTKPKKPKSFGRGFDLLLRHCEEWEDYFQGRTRKEGRGFDYNSDLFTMLPINGNAELGDEYAKYIVDMAENSWRLRNAFKFKLDWLASSEGATRDVAEQVLQTPLSPPFPQCVFYLENFMHDIDMILLIDADRTATHINTPEEIEAYSHAGITGGDDFVSIMPCLYRPEGIMFDETGKRDPSKHLSFMPIEIHAALHGIYGEPDNNQGIRATPKFAVPKEDFWMGDGIQFHQQIMSAVYFVLWLLSRSETRRIPGLSARKQGMKKPKGKRPFYEHHVVDIDPFAVNQVSGAPSGIKKGSPRFHAVRGFWRHYKQPIKTGPNKGKTQVWIGPQWRGDKEKGVITKDYNIVRSERDEDVE